MAPANPNPHPHKPEHAGQWSVMATCSNCHSADPRRAGSELCDACYMTERRTGRPRTEDNIVRHNRRRFEQEVERRRAR